MCLASPKSDTLTIRGYRLARSRFSGFKSRWTMPRECMYWNYVNVYLNGYEGHDMYRESIAYLTCDGLSLMFDWKSRVR